MNKKGFSSIVIPPPVPLRTITLSYSLASVPPRLDIQSDGPIDPLEGLTVLMMASQGLLQQLSAQQQMLVGLKKPSPPDDGAAKG